MLVETIELQDFRNYGRLKLSFSPGTNIFYGDNAQGKTNLLEAVFMGCTSKSYRLSRDRDLIRFGQEEAHIKMQLRKSGMGSRIDMHLKKHKPKGIAVDGIPIRKLSELFGLANVVCFSPEDLSLVKEGPALRRRFLDLELCQLDRIYLHDLAMYNRALNQRNRLLKDIAFNPRLLETLPAWDEELAKYGASIISRRGSFLQKMQPMAAENHRKLTGEREELSIAYEESVGEENFLAELQRLRESELRQHTTLAGPHRDDIRFTIDGQDLRKFGSQGQKRSAALALKLSEIEMVREQVQDLPILLLDDVLSELDSKRQNYLLGMLKDTQNLITCTGLDDFIAHRFPMDEVFLVERGTVQEKNRGGKN